MVDLDTISFRLLKTLEENGLSVGEAETVLKKAQKILKESVSNMELNIEEKE